MEYSLPPNSIIVLLIYKLVLFLILFLQRFSNIRSKNSYFKKSSPPLPEMYNWFVTQNLYRKGALHVNSTPPPPRILTLANNLWG